MRKLSVCSYGITHCGNFRATNQDAILQREAFGLWVVADGMGGHDDGDIASQTLVQSIDNLCQTSVTNVNLATVCGLLDDVNFQLYQQNQDLERIVGSTFALLSVQQEKVNCLWAGDSRIYHLRDHNLTALTRDHTVGNRILSSDITHKNSLTNAVGIKPELELEKTALITQPNDIFLLCSDGLNKELSDAEIAAIINYSPIEKAVDTLLTLCLSRRARDNISVIIVKVI